MSTTTSIVVQAILRIVQTHACVECKQIGRFKSHLFESQAEQSHLLISDRVCICTASLTIQRKLKKLLMHNVKRLPKLPLPNPD